MSRADISWQRVRRSGVILGIVLPLEWVYCFTILPGLTAGYGPVEPHWWLSACSFNLCTLAAFPLLLTMWRKTAIWWERVAACEFAAFLTFCAGIWVRLLPESVAEAYPDAGALLGLQVANIINVLFVSVVFVPIWAGFGLFAYWLLLITWSSNIRSTNGKRLYAPDSFAR
jgi:hypothetical protein